MSDSPEPPDLEVNIPVPGGLRVTADQPYGILVVSDLAGSDTGSLSGPLADGVVDVTADSFDELLKGACPSVNFTMTDPVAGGSKMVEADLRFDSLRAFDPKNLALAIPAARSLMETRDRIVARMRGQTSADDLAGAVAQAAAADQSLNWLADAIKAPPAAPPPDPDTVDDLLGQLDLGDGDAAEAKPPPKSPVGRVVSAAAGAGGIPAGESAALRKTLAEIDRRVSSWLTAVLHAPQVQGIESAWRGLAWLVSNIDFRKGLRLSVLHAPRGSIIERFTTRLIDPVFDEGAAAPNLIAVDEQFTNSAADLEVLDGLAQHAASLPAVILAGVSAGFFGVKRAWQIPTLPPLLNMFDQWQFAKFKALRGQGYARSLGVVFGRCLMRAPYGREDVPDLEFGYREPCLGDSDLVWASGAMAGACTVARSVADTGWPSGMAGRFHGRIEGLPRIQGGKTGDKWFGPADTQTPQPRVEEMGMSGINAVVGLPDIDDAIFWNGLTIARAAGAGPNALLEVSLPYQLFAGRLSALLWDLKPHLAGKSPEAVTATVLAHAQDWLKLEGEPEPEQVSAQVRPLEDDPSKLQLAVVVTPPQKILPGGIPVVMGYTLS